VLWGLSRLSQGRIDNSKAKDRLNVNREESWPIRDGDKAVLGLSLAYGGLRPAENTRPNASQVLSKPRTSCLLSTNMNEHIRGRTIISRQFILVVVRFFPYSFRSGIGEVATLL
jgi:hypothetical protein